VNTGAADQILVAVHPNIVTVYCRGLTWQTTQRFRTGLGDR
jgi:hypothetical protein